MNIQNQFKQPTMVETNNMQKSISNLNPPVDQAIEAYSKNIIAKNNEPSEQNKLIGSLTGIGGNLNLLV